MTPKQRLIIARHSGGLTYYDRLGKPMIKVHIARPSYATLNLVIEEHCPASLLTEIHRDSIRMRKLAGQSFQVDDSGYTVTLGSAIK